MYFPLQITFRYELGQKNFKIFTKEVIFNDLFCKLNSSVSAKMGQSNEIAIVNFIFLNRNHQRHHKTSALNPNLAI